MSTVQKLDRKAIKQKLDEGWIKAVVLFEIAGTPKEHIEKSLHGYLENIDTDDHIISLSKEFEETIEIDDGKLFSTAAEVEYLIYGLEKLTWFAFNFMPASIEIKEPSELTFKDKDFTNWMNDLLAKLHEVNTVHTSLKNEHTQLVKSMNAAMRNSIMLACEHESKSANDISLKIGMSEKATQPFLDAMLKEGRLVRQGKKYRKK